VQKQWCKVPNIKYTDRAEIFFGMASSSRIIAKSTWIYATTSSSKKYNNPD
jgi:hypothetical protein